MPAKPSSSKLSGPRRLLVALAAGVLCVLSPVSAGAHSSPSSARMAGAGRVERQLVDCVNRERTRRGLEALPSSDPLARAARLHARNMLSYGFFAHEDPWGRGPGERLALFDGRDWGVGENIAAGYAGAAATCRGWMKSAPHRANILDPDYEYVGAGYASGSRNLRRYYVLDFGILYEAE